MDLCIVHCVAGFFIYYLRDMRSGSVSWKFQKRILIVVQKIFRLYRNRVVHNLKIQFNTFIKCYK